MPKFNIGGFLEGTAYGVINEVLSGFRDDTGYAKPSRYEVTLHPPSGGRGKSTGLNMNMMSILMPQKTSEGTTRRTSLRCESIEFPGRNLDTTPDVNIYGPERNIVSGLSYADITGVFQCSTDLREKIFFETWQRLSFNPDTWNMGYYDDYTGTIQIFQLDEQDNRRYGVELIECFPKTVGELTYDYSAVNTQQKVQITFSYRYWKNLTDESNLPRSLQERLQTLLLNTVERQLTSRIPAVIRNL